MGSVVIAIRDFILPSTYFFLELILGDLFIDGKVIRRPQYTDMRQQATRSRPRPRYDRRRETMQVQRRETMQRQNMPQGQGVPAQPPTSMDSQNSS